MPSPSFHDVTPPISLPRCFLYAFAAYVFLLLPPFSPDAAATTPPSLLMPFSVEYYVHFRFS